MSAQAFITPEDLDLYRAEVLRVSGEQSRVLAAVQANTNQMAKLTETCRKLDDKIDRKFDQARRRLDSYSDLSNEKRTAELVAEVKRLRGMPAKVAKWLGWAVATALGILHIVHLIK